MAGCANPAKESKVSTAPPQPTKKTPKAVEPAKPTAETAATKAIEPVKAAKETAPGKIVEKAGEPVVLMLKFKQGQTATYKSIMETERGADFAGDIAKDEQFKSGKSGSRAEMTFSQQIENVDENGNATARITIKTLKYTATTKNVLAVGFDSTNQPQANILGRLIGQSYTIIINPSGVVIRTDGLDEIKKLVVGFAAENMAGEQLISENVVQKRHQIQVIADANGKKLAAGDKWSSSRTVTFGMMGANAFEKVYTLKAIEQKSGKKEAIIEINGMPATVQKNETSPLTKLFDSNNSFSGSLVLDLSSGQVERYNEKLQAEWTVADPQATGSEPSTIKLSTMELYSLEKVD